MNFREFYNVFLETCLEGAIRLANDEVTLFDQQPPEDFIKDAISRGRIEICQGGVYGSICDNLWDNRDASVVCSQKGFSLFGDKYIINC